MKEFSKIVFFGFIIAILLLALDLVRTYTSGKIINFNETMLISYAYYCMYTIPISLVNSYFFNYMNSHVVWSGTMKKYRLFIGIIGSTIITMFTYFLVRMMHVMAINGKTYTAFMQKESMGSYINVLLITFFFSLFFHALYFYKELQKKKVTEQKIIAGTASAQFDALKNQLDPHFLFNSLNVL